MTNGRLSDIHVPGLDGIRGLAILLVIPHNATLMLGLAYHGPGYFAKEYSVVGWIGVQLFFVLSGFLITGGLLDARGSERFFRNFYTRRVLRIFPLYFGVLLLTFGVLGPLGLLPAQTQATQHNQIWLWTFLSNWTDPRGMEVRGFAHFWSLAVEEQFYLIWPLLVYWLDARKLLYASVTLCAAAFIIRVTMRLMGIPAENLYEFTVCRMDALAFGAAAAALVRMPGALDRVRKWLPRLPILALVLLATGALLTHMYQRTGLGTQTFGMTTLAAGFSMLVLGASQLPRGSVNWFTAPLTWAPLRSVGKYSYGMYVFHMPLHLLVGEHLLGRLAVAPRASTAVIYAIAITVASYVIAFISYNLYEARFLRLKRYFAPAPAPAALPGAEAV